MAYNFNMLADAGALDLARSVLKEALGSPVRVKSSDSRVDAEIIVGENRFLVEVKSDARSASIARAIEQLQSHRLCYPDAGLLLVVPHMNDAGAEICKRAQVNWIDFDGNASIRERNLIVRIQGSRNRRIHDEGKNGLNPFAHKASRVAHVLLTDPKRLWTRAELQARSRLDKGFISKVLSELLTQDYLVEEAGQGRIRNVRVRNPMVLLDAWTEHYRRPKPYAWGLLAVRDRFDGASKVGSILQTEGLEYAITGLPAAAAYTNFGNFRRTDVYVSAPLSDCVIEKLHIDADGRGRNVAVIVDDFASNIGIQQRDTRRYVSPSRTYLDLAGLPERAEEARKEMRRYLEQQWK
jgi:hypothetical protein